MNQIIDKNIKKDYSSGRIIFQGILFSDIRNSRFNFLKRLFFPKKFLRETINTASLYGNKIDVLTKLFGKPNFLFDLPGRRTKNWYIYYEGFKFIISSHHERGTTYELNIDEVVPHGKNIDNTIDSFFHEMIKLYDSIK